VRPFLPLPLNREKGLRFVAILLALVPCAPVRLRVRAMTEAHLVDDAECRQKRCRASVLQAEAPTEFVGQILMKFCATLGETPARILKTAIAFLAGLSLPAIPS
jgi:hypothetical protein